MMFRWVLAVLALAMVAGCDTNNRDSGLRFISAAETNTVRVRHVDTVNALRASRGLGPVQLSARLTAAAVTHARDMSVQERAWHFGSDGTSPGDRAARAGFQGRIFGENISESFDDEEALFQSWLNDPVTRQVMLEPRARVIGFGWFQEPDGKLWWVQVFGGAPTI